MFAQVQIHEETPNPSQNSPYSLPGKPTSMNVTAVCYRPQGA